MAEGLELRSGAAQSVAGLGPGAEVGLRWRLRAASTGGGVLLRTAALVVRRGDTPIAGQDVAIVALPS